MSSLPPAWARLLNVLQSLGIVNVLSSLILDHMCHCAIAAQLLNVRQHIIVVLNVNFPHLPEQASTKVVH